jgi:ribonuclease E
MSPPGEGGRRRRRRRGRRGRRRDGEFGHPSGEGGPHNGTEAPIAAAPAYPAPVPQEEHPAVPNAESSPLWSLSDHSSAARAPAPEPTLEAEPPPVEAINPVAESRPVPANIESVPVTAPDDAANEVPREARKGWWQRRFRG